MVDQAYVSINQEFKQLFYYPKNFKSLYNIENLKLFENKMLWKHCKDVAIL